MLAKAKTLLLSSLLMLMLQTSCLGPSMGFNEDGSQPVNDEEALAYRRTMQRCHKNGGSRVVKIEGNLRCF